jgi:uracil phosphoribosyltransferase
MHTIIRDRNCSRENFIFYSNRLIRLLIEEALSLVPAVSKTVTTPTGETYEGDHLL